jgi:hypothetical protein
MKKDTHYVKDSSLIPELSVTSCETSLAFYCNVLGFSIVYLRPEEGFAFLEREGAQLMLDQMNKGRTFESVDSQIKKYWLWC